MRIKEVKRLESGKREWGEMVLVEVGSEEERWKVLEYKKLNFRREKRIWIGKDLTWKERRSKWMLKQIARREEAKRKRVWTRKNKNCGSLVDMG